jgi:hypothetical protein
LQVYGTKCIGIFGLPNPSTESLWNEGYWNNSCILPDAGDPYLDISGACDLTNKSAFTITMGNNKVYAANKSVSITCGKTMDWDTFQAAGVDVGSTIEEAPTAAEIIAMGQALLQW